MKILVLGGTGMAGHTISIYFKEAGHDVTAYSRRKVTYCKNINGDITNFKELEKYISSLSCQFVWTNRHSLKNA